MFETITIQDFSIAENENGKHLRVNIIGSYILFIGSNRENESNRIKKIVGSVNISGLSKTYYNLDSNQNLIKLASTTNTPIKTIPTIFFVTDGKIKAIYNKPVNINTMTNWFMEKIAKFSSAPVKITAADTGVHDVEFKRRPRTDPQNYSMNNNPPVGGNSDMPFIGANAAWRSDLHR